MNCASGRNRRVPRLAVWTSWPRRPTSTASSSAPVSAIASDAAYAARWKLSPDGRSRSGRAASIAAAGFGACVSTIASDALSGSAKARSSTRSSVADDDVERVALTPEVQPEGDRQRVGHVDAFLVGARLTLRAVRATRPPRRGDRSACPSRRERGRPRPRRLPLVPPWRAARRGAHRGRCRRAEPRW